MGLDMYLTREMYISGWPHSKNPIYDQVLALLDMDKYTTAEIPSLTISAGVIYWRKANAIHNWFVENVQEGVDDCKEYYVSGKQLKELQETCAEALVAFNNGNFDEVKAILPPAAGFFFGGTEVDEYYKEDLEKTILEIDKLEPLIEAGESFNYQSSW